MLAGLGLAGAVVKRISVADSSTSFTGESVVVDGNKLSLSLRTFAIDVSSTRSVFTLVASLLVFLLVDDDK